MSETIGAALARGTALLAKAGVEAPAREARLLLTHALGLSAPLDRAAKIEPARYDSVLTRRANREPFAYITGRQGFWTLDLAVSPDTLIPRPDSETLIEALRAHYSERPSPRHILDLGTGTGALLLAALSVFPHAWGVGVDRIANAAMLARINARTNGMETRSAFLVADWAAALDHRFDAVLCNPPYIRSGEIPALMPEVARHEAVSALDGGPDGFDAYRRLIPDLHAFLAPSGVAVLELGATQFDDVARIAISAGFSVAMRRDLGGNMRAIVLNVEDPG